MSVVLYLFCTALQEKVNFTDIFVSKLFFSVEMILVTLMKNFLRENAEMLFGLMDFIEEYKFLI